MNKTKIRYFNLAVSFSGFAICMILITLKLIGGQRLSSHDHFFGYFGLLCLLVATVSFLRLRNEKSRERQP